MIEPTLTSGLLEYNDLESRFGKESACVILRTLEQFEGIREEYVLSLSFDQRLKNVFRAMSENLRYQTRH